MKISRISARQLLDCKARPLVEVEVTTDTGVVARGAAPTGSSVGAHEAFILRELGMNAVLILPLQVAGGPWGLVELYEMRLRRFSDDAIAVARFLTGQAERRLAEIGARELPSRQPPVYELPSDAERRPRTR